MRDPFEMPTPPPAPYKPPQPAKFSSTEQLAGWFTGAWDTFALLTMIVITLGFLAQAAVAGFIILVVVMAWWVS